MTNIKLPLPATTFGRIIASMGTIVFILFVISTFLIISRGIDEFDSSELEIFETTSPYFVVQNYIVWTNSGSTVNLKNAYDLLSQKNQSVCSFENYRYINHNYQKREEKFRLSYPEEKQYDSSDPQKAYVTVKIEESKISTGVFFINRRNRHESFYEFGLIKEGIHWKIDKLPSNFDFLKTNPDRLMCNA